MKRFLLRLSIFLSVALLGSIVLAEAVIIMNRQAIGNCRLDAGVNSVIVGDSHTAWAIDDEGVEGLRNVSLNAEGYKYTHAKLAHLLRTEPGIRRVYLGFSYHNLSSYYDEYISGPTFRFFVQRYLAVLTLGDYAELVKSSPRHAIDLFIRVVREGSSSGIRRDCLLYGDFSEVPMNEEFNLPTVKSRIAAQYYSHEEVLKESKSNIEYLSKIIGLCRDMGVELVALNTPMHPEYKKRVPEEYRVLYDRYLQEHGLRSFDFHDLGLTDADFLPDGDHTNSRGARFTTRRFAEYHRANPVPSP